MTFLNRNSIKVLILNERQELLLMCADDPKTTSKDGKYHGQFWFPVGGEINPKESIEEAARREIYEETGLREVEFGPIVWFGEFDLILAGTRRTLRITNDEAEKILHEPILLISPPIT